MGFHKIWVDKDYNAGALGGFTYGVTTEEMAGGYAALANDGVYRKATCIRLIVDASNKTVVNETNRDSKVYDKSASRMMTQMLREVVLSGTGTSANVENAVVAGKRERQMPAKMYGSADTASITPQRYGQDTIIQKKCPVSTAVSMQSLKIL